MKNLLLQIIVDTLGLWLAVQFIGGVEFRGEIKYLIIAGAILGFISFFIKPILKLITLPLRILTLGIFGLVLNMMIIWIIDIIFIELVIYGIAPLFWTTILIWILNQIIGLNRKKH